MIVQVKTYVEAQSHLSTLTRVAILLACVRLYSATWTQVT